MFTNGTQNYNLPQWLPQDKPTWLGDMNSAFLAIDTNLKQVSDTATVASNAASYANTKIGTDDISSIGTSLTNAIVNLSNLIGVWTSQLGADIATVITTIKEDITRINSTIGTWTSQIGTNIARAITTLKDKVSTIETTIGTWSSSIGTSIASAIQKLQNDNIYTNGTYTVFHEQDCLGMLINAGKTISFNVTLPKQIEDGKTITLNSCTFYIRDNNGYLQFNDNTNMSGINKTSLENYATITIQHYGQILRVIIQFTDTVKSNGAEKVASSICGIGFIQPNITIS